MLVKFKGIDGAKQLTRAPLISENKIELHFSHYNSNEDYCSGFSLLNNDSSVCSDYENHKTKWNILTELQDGIVLTDLENNFETTDNMLFVPMQEQLDEWAKEELYQSRIDNQKIPTIDERIADIEKSICSLYESEGL